MQTVIAENSIPDGEAKGVDTVKIVLLSVVLAGLYFYLQGRIDLNMADEGFLWYGAVETALGKVPIRDFQAYDPGRYYWAAAWSFIFGDGIVALRLSSAIFLSMGLSLGLLAAGRALKSFPALLAAGILFTVWMHPVFHLVDMSIALASVFFAVRLIERPTLLRAFSSGVFVGVAAFFGRNFGIYGLLAFSALTLFIWFKTDRAGLLKRFTWLAAGIITGYSPMLILIVFIPGFFPQFIDSVLSLFRQGATNIALPVPWPWTHDYSSVNMLGSLYDFFLGSWFLIMPLFYLAALISIIFTDREKIKKRALFISSVFVGIFYMHYTFSRADINHLARGMQPLLLAFLSLPVAFAFCRKKSFLVAIWALVSLMTLTTVVMEQPAVKKNLLLRNSYVQYNFGGEKLWLLGGLAHSINTIERIVNERIGPDENIFFAPYLAGFYPLFRRESPTRQIYFLFPASTAEQEEIIRNLETKNVQWALIGNPPLDNRDDLRFNRTHNMVWRYLFTRFEVADPLPRMPDYVLLRKRKV